MSKTNRSKESKRGRKFFAITLSMVMVISMMTGCVGKKHEETVLLGTQKGRYVEEEIIKLQRQKASPFRKNNQVMYSLMF